MLLGQRGLKPDTEGGSGYVLSCKSLVDPELCPELSDTYVRANAIISGFILKELPQNATEITYLFQGKFKPKQETD